jgi:hypothetical protein
MKCTKCGATLTYIVEHFDWERGGEWWAYNVKDGVWDSPNRKELVGFSDYDSAHQFFTSSIGAKLYRKLRIRRLVSYSEEQVVEEYTKNS